MQKKLQPAEASTSMGGEGSLEDSSGSGGGGGNGGSQPKTAEEMIKIGLDALATGRSMGTRRLAIVQEDPNVTKVVKLAQILREMFAQVTSVNGKRVFLDVLSGRCVFDFCRNLEFFRISKPGCFGNTRLPLKRLFACAQFLTDSLPRQAFCLKHYHNPQ